jgi:hypothetical protein
VRDVLRADRLLGEAALEGRAERRIAMRLLQRVERSTSGIQVRGRRWGSSVRYASAAAPRSIRCRRCK